MERGSVKSTRIIIPVIFLVVLSIVSSVIGDEEPDPVLEYYWDKAARAAVTCDPAFEDLPYSCNVRSYRYRMDSEGRKVFTDSLLTVCFFSGGRLDSQQVIGGEVGRFKNLDLSFPNIFEWNYHTNLFPNDTGGAELAIGILSDSTNTDQPEGLMIIDRNQGYLRRLYLYYPNKPGYQRFTRSFRFVFKDGYVFPDSIWEVGTTLGVFSSHSYRIETGLTDFRWQHR